MAVNESSFKRSREDSNSEEPVLSLVDVLEENEELENEACAVLGGSDPETCSYAEGYVKRQALYACNTCTPKGGEAAGVCLACSYKCHEGHELFELYTKRNFRCDCGNSKFKGLECKFFKEKDKVNAGNKYNHNFFGLYCTCQRPYPDPEDETPDEMIQCVACEDWFHGRHLGAFPPDSIDFQEMVCQNCMTRCSFLWTYATQLTVPTVTKVTSLEDSGVELKVDVGDAESGENIKQENGVSHQHDTLELKPELPAGQIKNEQISVKEETGKTDMTSEPSTSSSAESQSKTLVNGEVNCNLKKEEATASTDVQEDLSHCRLHELKAQALVPRDSATFWHQNWRSKLCTCQDCKKLYADLGVLFLLDETDTVLAYEHKGKTSEDGEEGRLDPLMAALSNMNRFQQVELIYEYNDLKSELKDYLKRFAEEGKVVTSEDIQQFFEELRSRKRRRMDGMQYYCS